MKVKEEVTSLNARVPVRLRRAFDVAVAQRGVTKQQAMREALSAWIAERQASAPVVPFPLFPSKSERKFELTREQVDDASIG